MDSRTTAGPVGPKDYAFYRVGGSSWTAPWIAGLYALACQIDPGITPDVFWKAALDTGDSLEFPPKRAAFSEKEIEKLVAKTVDEQMAKFDAKFGTGPEREKAMTDIYNQSTGKKVEKISEADFRAWGAATTRERLIQRTKPSDTPVVLEKIANPAKLIAALQAAVR
jgi:hypothetical protein